MDDISMQEVLARLSKLDVASMWIGGPVGMEAVRKAETVLGLSLPDEFLAFVTRFGWGGPDGLTIFGIDDERAEDEYPSLVEETVAARDDGLPPEFIVIASSGDGGSYVMRCGGQGHIHVWYPGQSVDDDLETSDESFAEFLMLRI